MTAYAAEDRTESLECSNTTDVSRAHSGAGSQKRNSRSILGINFFAGTARDAVALGLKGGLVVAPAAPALVNLPHDDHYRFAVTSADLAITDSSLMVMLWNLMRRDNIPRVSGLEYLTLLLQSFKQKNHEPLFFVMPTKKAAVRTSDWLNKVGISWAESHCYVAPLYETTNVEDSTLLTLLEELKPAQIIIGLGGGTQEKLGLFLRKRLSYKPGIHCIGAAVAFLTGDQVEIPMWADRLFLGWLFRCMAQPRSYIPRYWTARKLFWQMISSRPVQKRVDACFPAKLTGGAMPDTGLQVNCSRQPQTTDQQQHTRPVSI